MKLTKRIAFLLCEDRGYLPLALEPGDIPKVDKYLPNGDPAHYMYRELMPLAKKIVAEIKKK